MERIHVISNAREELAEAVSSGLISPPSPIACSPWVAMSVMQKAIRRGREDLALRAAATLQRDAPESTFERVPMRLFSFKDPEENTREQIEKVRSHPWIAKNVPVRGFIFDVHTGRLREVKGG
jgi:carbonic anhydrase